jgi:hypothetical protein
LNPRTTEAEAKSIVDKCRSAVGARIGEIELAANLVAIGEESLPWLKRFVGRTFRNWSPAGWIRWRTPFAAGGSGWGFPTSPSIPLSWNGLRRSSRDFGGI